MLGNLPLFTYSLLLAKLCNLLDGCYRKLTMESAVHYCEKFKKLMGLKMKCKVLFG